MHIVKVLFKLLFLVLITPLMAGASHAQSLQAHTDADALPDTQVAFGSQDIAQAWLTHPTQRYPHYVRGIPYEAGSLRVRGASGQIFTLQLDSSQVFEDRIPRLADLDGDGRDEILLVLSSVERGAALAAYSLGEDGIFLKSRTPFIGRAFRWLNPAGIADFDGDGQLDVAIVQMPHLAKRLELWTLRSGQFVRILQVENVSNHRNGSAYTELSAHADIDGDGVADLIVPNGSYSQVRVLSFSGGQVHEISNYSLPSQAAGNFTLSETSDGWQVAVPLDDGRVTTLSL